MKTKWWIMFDARDVAGGAATILDAASCGPDVANVLQVPDSAIFKGIDVTVKLDDGDERIAKLHELLNRYGVEVEACDYIEYSDEDLQSARLLWMEPDINVNVDSGHKYGTKYDMTEACPNCAAGVRQTSALYIDGDEGPAKIRKHRAIGSWDGEILVDGGMVKKLKDAGVTGISFGDVRARLKNKKWSMMARDQILIAHTMPPRRFEPTTIEDEHLCKVCRRGGFGWAPLKSYRSEDLVGMQDFNLTWEWFGEFWPKPKEKRHYAKWPSPGVLVTPKVMNIFREAGVTTFEWKPVFLDEEEAPG